MKEILGKIVISLIAALSTLTAADASTLSDTLRARTLTNDSVAIAEVSPAAGQQSVGLVLSGGGAKGIAHIGVIQALEDNDIPIDYIAGTSMGAIIGSLYAIGYTPQEMLDLILSNEFKYWSTGQNNPKLIYYINRQKETPAILNFPLSRKDSLAKADAPPESLISPLQMTFAYMDIFAPYTAQCGGDFDKLFVPFRAVASDTEARKSVVLSSGNISDAVRASMSFPAVFQPTLINDRMLYDGGIFNNYPFSVMRRDFSPSIMIGSNVSTGSNPNTTIFNQMENLIMMKQNYNMPAREGISIKFNLSRFGLLDFQAANEIYTIGYNHAMEMMDSIKSRVKTRIPAESRNLQRDVFKSRTPYLRFDSVEISGGTPRQNQYLRYIFSKPEHSDTFGVAYARTAYYRAISTGKIRDLDPQAVYNDSTGLFTLKMKASVKDNFNLGLGGYVTSSNNNYLYASADYSTLSFHSMGANAGVWLGQNYLAADISGRLYLRTPIPSFISLQAVVNRQKFYESEYLFYEDKLPAFIMDNEYFGKFRWSFAAGTTGRLDLGAGLAHIYGNFYNDNSTVSHFMGKDKIRQNLASVFLNYDNSTLDDINYPLSGHSYKATAMAVRGNSRLIHQTSEGKSIIKQHPEWLQMELRTKNYFPFGRHFVLGAETDIMLSTRKLLPTYTASLVNAPAYYPTPASNHAFNPGFRSNSFIAAGLVPVYKYNDNLSARLSLNGFLPIRPICHGEGDKARYGNWFSSPKFFGELDLVYRFPMVSISAYCNYSSYPANWNVGLGVGIFLLAPKFLR